MSFLSKSVQMSCGGLPTLVMNCFICRSSDIVRFFSGYILLNLVALSMSIRQYLTPPIADVSPNLMSMCHSSLYTRGVSDGFVFRFLDCMVA